jgi:membrane-associated phospholipid phosphatase
MHLLFVFLSFLNISFVNALSYELIKTSDTHIYRFSDGRILTYKKSSFLKDFSQSPKDFSLFIKNSFAKENLKNLGYITASTLVLIKYDREIYEETQRFGRRMNISNKDKTKTFISFNGTSIFRGPTDLGSAMYFIGDGWVSILLFGSFKTYGILENDLRASKTANQIAEGLFITGFTTQFLKWSFGREMPNSAEIDTTGKWRGFSKDYIKHRRRYDAFPSGHLATGAMCLSVISYNYPEKKYIKPLGYSLLTLLSFQMINNGVHWASDYPLGFAIGWGIGRAIASRNQINKGIENKSSIEIYPYFAYETKGFIGRFRF